MYNVSAGSRFMCIPQLTIKTVWDIKSYNPSAKPKTYRKSLHTYTDWNICIDTPLFPVCFRRLGLVDVYGTIILYTSTLGRKLKATYFFLYFVIFFFILFLPKNLNSSIAITLRFIIH